MTQRAFNRTASLTLSRPAVAAGRFGKFGSYFQPAPNGIEISGGDVDKGLRFTFRVEKDLEPEPNYADIVIYNLPEQFRAEFQRKPVHVRLEAGYDGQTERVLVGDMRWADQRKGSVDWETRLQVGDGDRAFRSARVGRSFKPGVTGRTAIAETLGAMGLNVGAALDTIDGIDREFAGGLTLSGKASGELTRLLKPHGATWSVQDGRFQVLRDRDVRTGVAAVLGDGGTPIIGAPEYGPPSDKGKPPVLTVTTLLYPSLTPGGLIRVNDTVTGLFKMIRIVHSGDTHGQDWYTTVEATAR